MSVIVGFVVLSASFILHERIGWGTVVNMMFIGPREDLALAFIPSVKENTIIQVAMLFVGILIRGSLQQFTLAWMLGLVRATV